MKIPVSFKKEQPECEAPEIEIVPQPPTDKSLDEFQLEECYGIGFKLLRKAGHKAGEGLRKGALATPLSNTQQSRHIADGSLRLKLKDSEKAEIAGMAFSILKVIHFNYRRGAFICQLLQIILADPALPPSLRRMLYEEQLRDSLALQADRFCIDSADFVSLVRLDERGNEQSFRCECCGFKSVDKNLLFRHFYQMLHPSHVERLRSELGLWTCRFCGQGDFLNSLALVNHCKGKADHSEEFGPCLLGNILEPGGVGVNEWIEAALNPGLHFDWKQTQVVDLGDEEDSSSVVVLDDD